MELLDDELLEELELLELELLDELELLELDDATPDVVAPEAELDEELEEDELLDELAAELLDEEPLFDEEPLLEEELDEELDEEEEEELLVPIPSSGASGELLQAASAKQKANKYAFALSHIKTSHPWPWERPHAHIWVHITETLSAP